MKWHQAQLVRCDECLLRVALHRQQRCSLPWVCVCFVCVCQLTDETSQTINQSSPTQEELGRARREGNPTTSQRVHRTQSNTPHSPSTVPHSRSQYRVESSRRHLVVTRPSRRHTPRSTVHSQLSPVLVDLGANRRQYGGVRGVWWCTANARSVPERIPVHHSEFGRCESAVYAQRHPPSHT